MGKIFGKRPSEWLRLPSVVRLVEALCENEGLNSNVGKSHICENQLVIVKEGSPENGGGTWLHQDLAIDFAGWLDIKFKLWCNERLKEIFKYGVTATDEALEKAVMDPDFMIGVLEHLKEARAKLKEQQPKVEYYDKVLNTTNLFNITEIAQELGLTSIKLNKLLHEKGVQHKVGDMWCLTKDYLDKEYADVSTYMIITNSGEEVTRHHLKWTEKGREFIHGLIKNN